MEQIFTEQERRVFQYWNGVAQVWGDPVRIYRRVLSASDGDINILLERTSPEVQVVTPTLWAESVERLVQVVRDAFEMAPFNPETGTGATETDCLNAIKSWQGWMDEKKEPAAS